MAFEEVKKEGRGSSSNEPRVSLRKSGGIGINSAAMEQWFEDATHVKVYHDEENNRIGLQPFQEEVENSFKINRTEGSEGSTASGGVTPSRFLNENQLVPDVTTRYEADWDEDEGMVVVDLSESKGTYGSPDEDEEE